MICVSVTEKDQTKLLSVANSCEMAEIRIDLCCLDESSVEQVFSKLTVPAIATCRPQYCEDGRRALLLKKAIIAGAKFVDVEIESDSTFKADVIACAQEHSCKVIVSYHNYENTPSHEELCNIVSECYSQGADIAKVATTAKTQADCANVLSLYNQEKPLVALAMGTIGRITRVANLFLGSPFSFAAIDEAHATAGGQLTVEQMSLCRKILK